MGQPVLPNPHGLGAAVALGIAFVSLEDGEQVEPVIRGQIQDSPGFAVLPDRRVILSDEAAGVPLVRTVEIDPGLRVEGEAGAQTATITCTTPLGAWQAVGSQDVDLTEDFTVRLRAQAAGA